MMHLVICFPMKVCAYVSSLLPIADGNCLFRAVSAQLHDDGGAAHATLRRDVASYAASGSEAEYFSVVAQATGAPDATSYAETIARDGACQWRASVRLIIAAQCHL